MNLIEQLRLNAEDFRYENGYASHGVLMLNAALDLENYARWTEHLEAENQRLVDKANALTLELQEAEELLFRYAYENDEVLAWLEKENE